MFDSEAWEKYPQHHKWFNKLYLAEKMGYNCGPCGVAPKMTGIYIVRPIYNLSGMGAGASVKRIKSGDTTQVPPGYFWCEFYSGYHYSVTYTWNDGWEQISCYQGYNTKYQLTYFEKWVKVNMKIIPPSIFDQLSDVDYLNIEYKGLKPIEVHLRTSSDPEYDILIPIWQSTKSDIEVYKEKGYSFLSDYEDADGFISDPRIGFMVKDIDER